MLKTYIPAPNREDVNKWQNPNVIYTKIIDKTKKIHTPHFFNTVVLEAIAKIKWKEKEIKSEEIGKKEKTKYHYLQVILS